MGLGHAIRHETEMTSVHAKVVSTEQASHGERAAKFSGGEVFTNMENEQKSSREAEAGRQSELTNSTVFPASEPDCQPGDCTCIKHQKLNCEECKGERQA